MEMAKFDIDIEIISEREPMIVAINQEALVNRMDPGFWNPRYLEFQKFKKYPLRALGEYKPFITYGPIVTGQAPTSLGDWSRGVLIVGQKQLTDVGLDLTEAEVVAEGSRWDSARARLRQRDILFPRSGVGSLGKDRVAVWTTDDIERKAVVSCFVDIIRLPLDVIQPEYVAIYIKTRFGRMQINRWLSGVGTINVDFDDIRSLQIHEVPEKIQEQVVSEYYRVLQINSSAMYNKEKMLQSERQGNERAAQRYRREYEENLRKAESMLANLIKQVEEIIESKRSKIEPIEVESKVEQLVEVR